MKILLITKLWILFSINIIVSEKPKLKHPIFTSTNNLILCFKSNTINHDSLSKKNKWNIDSLIQEFRNSISKTITIKNDSEYRKEKLLKYVELIKSDLNMNIFPQFFYDPCLDQNDVIYYFLDSHTDLSIRVDILNSLNAIEIQKLISLGHRKKLKFKCNYKSYIEHLPYMNKSTWELIKMKEKGIIIQNNYR